MGRRGAGMVLMRLLAGMGVLAAAAASLVEAESTARADGEGAAEEKLVFFSLGDWGLEIGATMAAQRMDAIMAESGYDAIDFTLLLGDNFYETGIESVLDPHTRRVFEEPFSGPFTGSNAFYACAGNHDYYASNGVEPQLQYTAKNDLWNFPHYYHAHDFHKGETDVFVLGVDTWRLVGGDTYVEAFPGKNTERSHAFLRSRELVEQDLAAGVISQVHANGMLQNFQTVEEAGAQELVEDLRKQQQMDRLESGLVDGVSDACQTGDWEQLAWIDAQLAQASASGDYDWLIVMGHYPVFSLTENEHGDTPTLIDCLYPLLQKYNVDAYLNGHDHVLQHIQKNEDETTFFGVGAGAKISGPNKIDETYEGAVWAESLKLGFAMHELTETEMKTSFILSRTGDVPHTVTRTSLQH